MRLVTGELNGQRLLGIHESAIRHTEAVKAAVAYVSDEYRLITDCARQRIPLVFYGRYDASVPVAPSVLKLFLDAKSPALVCKLVPDIFHPKVIWWQGVGVYIGSANLTARGWFRNIEAGLYLDDAEIAEHGMDEELNDFFQEVDRRSYPLTQELYEGLVFQEAQLSDLASARHQAEASFERRRQLRRLSPLTHTETADRVNRARGAFIREWMETLQELRDVGARVSTVEYRPHWISSEAPAGVQADQFLHAYYYNHVKQGNRSQHYEFHEKNKHSPEEALITAMEWWHSLENPPSGEGVTIGKWAPFLKAILCPAKITSLSKDEFVEVCRRVHALRAHALRVRNSTLGLAEGSQTEEDTRIQLLAEWLFARRSSGGMTALQTLEFVLYGGPASEIANRIWEATFGEKWKIDHFGVSMVGEIVGWALPELFPPRNGRTSKALFALGFSVRIHSE